MNSIEQKRKSTIQEVQFDETLQETKNQIEQINKLAQRLGYVNPLEYEFVYLEPTK